MKNKAQGKRQRGRGAEGQRRISIYSLLCSPLLRSSDIWRQAAPRLRRFPPLGLRAALLLPLLLISCQSVNTTQGLQVKVTRVVSGQTLEVTGIGGQATRVRLIGIDAPDLEQQPWGSAAKERLEALIGDGFISLEFDTQKQDSFGRHLAYVWQDKVMLNEQLVKEGYVLSAVQASPNYKYNQQFERAQESARLMGQEIWNPEKPLRLTPVEFRRQNR